jgi:Tol biopolymer transport system component
LHCCRSSRSGRTATDPDHGSQDSKRIAYNADHGDPRPNVVSNSIKIVSLEDESIDEIVPDLKDVKQIYHLDWSPDGKTPVFAGYVGGGGPEFWTIENFLGPANGNKSSHDGSASRCHRDSQSPR